MENFLVSSCGEATRKSGEKCEMKKMKTSDSFFNFQRQCPTGISFV